MSPRDWTLRELFTMACGKREEERQLLLSQRQLIGSLFGEQEETDTSVRRFIRQGGSMVAERDKDRNRALVDAAVEKIRRDGNKVIFPCQAEVT
jgi:hypothetical protein